jgi:hypothetical protein
MVYIWRGIYSGTCTSPSGGTATYSNVPVTYKIKSNALTFLGFRSLATSGSGYPYEAALQGGANLQLTRQSDGVVICSEGGSTFTAKVVDTGLPSSNVGDTFYLTYSGKTFSKAFANALPLNGGNIVIHMQ